MYDALPDRLGHCVCAACGVELVDQGPDMELGRVDRYSQSARDSLVGGAFGHEGQYWSSRRVKSTVSIGGGAGLNDLYIGWLAASCNAQAGHASASRPSSPAPSNSARRRCRPFDHDRDQVP